MKVIKQIPKLEYDLIIEPSLREIESEFGIHLTIHDLKGRLHHSDGRPLLPGRNEHQLPCCNLKRYEEPHWNERCHMDCYRQTEQTANQFQQPFIKLCWKGMAELVVPIFLRDQHLLSILAGTFQHPDGIPEASNLPEWFYSEYAKLPLLDTVRLEQISRVLRLIGNGMIMWKENKLNLNSHTGRKAQIYQFIEDRAHENVSLADLGKAIGVSPSRARHLVRELTNRNFKSLLEEERMLRARYLLQSTNNTLEAVAETIGFKNGYYFNRAFKNYFGEPPGRFRKRLEQEITE